MLHFYTTVLAVTSVVIAAELDPTTETVWEAVDPGTLPGESLKNKNHPSVRYGAGSASTDDGFIVSQGYYYGHHSGKAVWVGDTWRFDFAKLKWWLVGTHGEVPSSRYKHSMVKTPDGMVMVGGDDGGHEHSMTHIWGAFKSGVHLLAGNSSYSKWYTLPVVVTPRQGHSTVYYKGFLVIFGGIVVNADRGETSKDASNLIDTNDLILVHLESGAVEQIPYKSHHKLPPERRSHAAVQFQGYMYIHGGFSRYEVKNLPDFWALNLDSLIDHREVAWEDLTSTTPPFARGGHVMVVDEILGKAFLHGGAVCSPGCITHTDLWEYQFNVGEWNEVVISRGMKPAGRHFHSSGIDQNNHYMYITGGESYAPYGYFNDIWRISLIGRKPVEQYVDGALVYDGIGLKTIQGDPHTTTSYLTSLRPPIYREHDALVAADKLSEARRLLETASTSTPTALIGIFLMVALYYIVVRGVRRYMLGGKRDD